MASTVPTTAPTTVPATESLSPSAASCDVGRYRGKRSSTKQLSDDVPIKRRPLDQTARKQPEMKKQNTLRTSCPFERGSATQCPKLPEPRSQGWKEESYPVSQRNPEIPKSVLGVGDAVSNNSTQDAPTTGRTFPEASAPASQSRPRLTSLIHQTDDILSSRRTERIVPNPKSIDSMNISNTNELSNEIGRLVNILSTLRDRYSICFPSVCYRWHWLRVITASSFQDLGAYQVILSLNDSEIHTIKHYNHNTVNCAVLSTSAEINSAELNSNIRSDYPQALPSVSINSSSNPIPLPSDRNSSDAMSNNAAITVRENHNEYVVKSNGDIAHSDSNVDNPGGHANSDHVCNSSNDDASPAVSAVPIVECPSDRRPSAGEERRHKSIDRATLTNIQLEDSTTHNNTDGPKETSDDHNDKLESSSSDRTKATTTLVDALLSPSVVGRVLGDLHFLFYSLSRGSARVGFLRAHSQAAAAAEILQQTFPNDKKTCFDKSSTSEDHQQSEKSLLSFQHSSTSENRLSVPYPSVPSSSISFPSSSSASVLPSVPANLDVIDPMTLSLYNVATSRNFDIESSLQSSSKFIPLSHVPIPHVSMSRISRGVHPLQIGRSPPSVDEQIFSPVVLGREASESESPSSDSVNNSAHTSIHNNPGNNSVGNSARNYAESTPISVPIRTADGVQQTSESYFPSTGLNGLKDENRTKLDHTDHDSNDQDEDDDSTKLDDHYSSSYSDESIDLVHRAVNLGYWKLDPVPLLPTNVHPNILADAFRDQQNSNRRKPIRRGGPKTGEDGANNNGSLDEIDEYPKLKVKRPISKQTKSSKPVGRPAPKTRMRNRQDSHSKSLEEDFDMTGANDTNALDSDNATANATNTSNVKSPRPNNKQPALHSPKSGVSKSGVGPRLTRKRANLVETSSAERKKVDEQIDTQNESFLKNSSTFLSPSISSTISAYEDVAPRAASLRSHRRKVEEFLELDGKSNLSVVEDFPLPKRRIITRGHKHSDGAMSGNKSDENKSDENKSDENKSDENEVNENVLSASPAEPPTALKEQSTNEMSCEKKIEQMNETGMVKSIDKKSSLVE